MKKFNFFLMLLLAASMAIMSPVAPTHAQDNTIVIGVVSGQLKFNVTEINLDTNTEYTIIFVNNDEFGASHNLRIDVNGDLQSNDNIDDTADTTIGVANTDSAGAAGKADGSAKWTGTYTTGSDGEVLYYCGFPGHYDSGMSGKFIVGQGKSPGFGFFLSGFVLVTASIFVTNYRRNH